MSGISLHAVDVSEGVPAQGLRVCVLKLGAGNEWASIATGELEHDGTLQHPITRGTGITEGMYEAQFHLGDWWRSRGSQGPFFQEIATFRFVVTDKAEHYHLPLKFTRWGLALFRGA